jgi:hypothetical protein
MKITEDTLTILQNFATINPNIVVEDGTKKLKTVSEAKNIMATAEIEDNIDASFGLYDLNEFLSAINLIDDPVFEFNSDKIKVNNAKNKQGLTYFCANPEILTHPKKDISDPEYDVTFTFSNSNIAAIRKAASVLGFDTVSLKKEKDESTIWAEVSDPFNKSSNAYRLDVGSVDGDASFSFDFLIANLKIVPGDYTVSLSSMLISKWASEDNAVNYWVALEKTSNYNN